MLGFALGQSSGRGLRFDPEGCIPSRPEEGGLSAVEWVKNKRGRHFIPSPFIGVEEG